MSTQQMTQQLVVFALGDEEYALPIQQVQEIIRYSEPRAVSSTEPWIRGVISLRGKIVPVFDLGLRLGLHAEPGQDQKIVIVETGSGTAGGDSTATGGSTGAGGGASPSASSWASASLTLARTCSTLRPIRAARSS